MVGWVGASAGGCGQCAGLALLPSALLHSSCPPRRPPPPPPRPATRPAPPRAPAPPHLDEHLHDFGQVGVGLAQDAAGVERGKGRDGRVTEDAAEREEEEAPNATACHAYAHSRPQPQPHRGSEQHNKTSHPNSYTHNHTHRGSERWMKPTSCACTARASTPSPLSGSCATHRLPAPGSTAPGWCSSILPRAAGRGWG